MSFHTGWVKSSHKPLMRATTLPPERSETGPKFNPLVHLREPPRCSKKTGTLTVQSWDRVKGTKRTRVMERIRVSLGAIFSSTVSCCGASMDPSGADFGKFPTKPRSGVR